MRHLISCAVLVALTVASLANGATHRVTVRCDQPDLVAGQRLWIVRYGAPRPRQNTRALVNVKPTFDAHGRCEVRLDDGEYRFDVMFKLGDGLVALTAGRTKIEADRDLKIKAHTPVTIQLREGDAAFSLDELTLRVEGTASFVKWERPLGAAAAAPEVILSPGHDLSARLIGRRQAAGGPVHAVLWTGLNPARPTLDLSRWDGWLGRARFEWMGEDGGLSKVKGAAAKMYLPLGDELDLTLEPGVTLVTNRRYIETSYSYKTAAGEHLEFNRRSHLLSPEHTIGWGGALTASAYARVAMKWEKPGRSLLWGAYLHNAAGDVVSLNEFPREKPHRRTPFGRPTYLGFRQPFAEINWKQTLHRVDGGYIPADLENLTPHDLQTIGDLNRMHEHYLVAVSYTLDGKAINANVPVSQFVTWNSKRVSLEAPLHWRGRATAYLDRTERVYAICQPMQLYTPDFIQMFWTNNYGAGYTIGPRTRKRIQMGFFDLRDRKGLYSLPDILVHEVLHAFGYKHGRAHNQAILKGRRKYREHRVYMADHPAYLPEPIEIDYSVEDMANHGSGHHDRFSRHPVPRDEATRTVDLGPFRGHTPKVQTEKEALAQVLSLRKADPLPASWNEATDLLKPVDPAKHAVNGSWTKSDGQLVSPSKPYARVQLGVAPAGGYELECQFTRIQGDCLAVMLPVGQTGTTLIVSGWAGKVSGLAYIAGRDADRNATTRDGKLPNGRKHTLRVVVQLLAGDQARVAVTLDGKPYITWQGARSALRPDRQWRLPRTGALGVGAYDARVVVHGCQVRPLAAAARERD